MKKIILGVILIIAVIVVLTVIPSNQAPAPMPWKITQMPDGQVSVFNIHLGTTNYRQAQQALGLYGQTAIFSDPDNHSTVEAYFNSINLGGLSAKLVLNLNINPDDIEEMKSRATQARIQPSGAHRYQLSNKDKAFLIDAPVIAITYIPSVKLDKTTLVYRFGEPAYITRDVNNTDTVIWKYPDLGLTIYLNTKEKTILEYQLKN